MAAMFAWLRPNDLIWNYWVNNYLLGNKPPAFDILAWNADTTRLPAKFHSDLLDIMEKNPYRQRRARWTIQGVPIDLSQVEIGAYVVGGITDHITPWKSCYGTARMFGEDTTFVLANAGHLQSLINPPGAPKAFFSTAPSRDADPEDWAARRCGTKGAGGRTGGHGCSSAPVCRSRPRKSRARALIGRSVRLPERTCWSVENPSGGASPAIKRQAARLILQVICISARTPGMVFTTRKP